MMIDSKFPCFHSAFLFCFCLGVAASGCLVPDSEADHDDPAGGGAPLRAGRSYLGELGDLLAHLAVHLVIIELLLDVGQLCRSPVHGGARRGGGGGSGGLCSLTGACSHDEPPLSLSQGNFYDRRTVRKDPAATQKKKKKSTRVVSDFYSRISPLSCQQRLEDLAAKHLLVDRRGSARALRLLPHSPAGRPAITEVTSRESIGDALQPPLSVLSTNVGDIFICPILMGESSRMNARGPTTCLAAGAGRSACIYGALPEKRSAAVLPRPYRRCCRINERRGAGEGPQRPR